ncbi:MFS transporter [Patescibacteria group bacterium]
MKEKITNLFKNAHFLRLWGSQAFSQTTAYLLNFVLMLRIYQQTGLTTALSIFLLVYTAPSVLLGLFAGALIDHWSKKRILLLSNLYQAGVVLLYLLVGQEVIWPLYLIVFLYSLGDEFFSPAQGAYIPSLVPKDHLPLANSFFMFTAQGAIILGPWVGGVLIKIFPFWFPYILAFLLLMIGVLFVRLLPKDEPRKKKTAKKLKIRFQELIGEIIEGYSFIRAKPRVYYSFWFYLLAQIIIVSVIILIPSLTGQILRTELIDTGSAVLLPAGLGAFVGTWYVTISLKKWGRKVLIAFGWLLSGFCLLGLGILVSKLAIGWGVLFLVGIGAVLVILPSLTMIQENTPKKIRGRVFGSLNALMVISAYLPVLFLGVLADWLGTRFTLSLLGMIMIIVGGLSLKVDRKLILSAKGASNNKRDKLK